MAFTASQYLSKISIPTATTATTIGGYTVPAATKATLVALTVSNTATTNLTTYADVSLSDGTTTCPIVVKIPLYPGGAQMITGIEKHILATSGFVSLTAYSTNVSAYLSFLEVT